MGRNVVPLGHNRSSRASSLGTKVRASRPRSYWTNDRAAGRPPSTNADSRRRNMEIPPELRFRQDDCRSWSVESWHFCDFKPFSTKPPAWTPFLFFCWLLAKVADRLSYFFATNESGVTNGRQYRVLVTPFRAVTCFHWSIQRILRA